MDAAALAANLATASWAFSMCDTLGKSGAPILLLSQGAAKVVGIHSSRVQELEPNVGWKTLKALGVSASEFGQSTLRATP